MKKLGILFVGALVALLSLAPVAGAKGKHHGRTLKVCGFVDATSTLPGTLVIATGGTRLVTIQNTTPVVLTPDIVVGADVCAKAKVVRAAPAVARKAHSAATKTKVLVSVAVRPAAAVEAKGPVTLGTGQITVATLTFLFPTGFTLSPKITDGKVVKALGTAALPDGVITLDRVKRNHHRSSRSHASTSTATAVITGRVSDLVPATATVAGSLKVGGIALVIPVGKVLRAKVTDGAFVAAKAFVDGGVLTVRRVKVLSVAVTPAV